MTAAALTLHLRLQSTTTVPDAVSLAIDAINAGATAAEAQQAIDEWVALQGAQVQQVFAGPARRDCCAGIHREHPQTADITDYLRLKGEIQ